MTKQEVDEIGKAITAGIMVAIEEILDAFPPPAGDLQVFAAETKVKIRSRVRAKLRHITTE